MFNIISQGVLRVLGAGTEADPYQIRTAAQLKSLSDCVAAGNECTNKFYIQTAHIDLSGYTNWVPIGNATDKRFLGNYDGNG
jgi:hypothetical protein